MAAIATDVGDSPLLRTLALALARIRPRLDDPAAWVGLRLTEPGTTGTYLRVTCVDDLVSRRGDVYGVAVHLFDRGRYDGRLHDHRWPIAVLPLDLAGRRGEPLYEMPWEDSGGGSGVMLVRSQQPWAIERCRDVRHAVRSLAPHVSIMVANHSQPAARPDRMERTPLDDAEVAKVLAAVRVAFG